MSVRVFRNEFSKVAEATEVTKDGVRIGIFYPENAMPTTATTEHLQQLYEQIEKLSRELKR